MHVIVTGGAGFVGSNVAARYLGDGHRVTVLDSLRRRGTERNLQWLRSLPRADRLEFVRGDVRDGELVKQLVGAADVDLVFHFAAQTAVTTSIDQPRADFEINLQGTLNVLEGARLTAAKRPPIVFFTSTNKVYGALERHRTEESRSRYRFADPTLDASGIDEREPLDFHSPYGCSKGAADQYARDYARIYGVPTVVFRMSCIYGTRQFGNEDQGWVAHFLISAATGAPLTIYGTGKQVRDMLYVDDLVDAFQRAEQNIAATAGQVYNIGGGPTNTISIWREFGPRLEQLAGRPIRPRVGRWRPGDQPIYVSNCAAAGRDFGWAPTVGVDAGLARLWAWVQDHRHAFPSPAAERPLEAPVGLDVTPVAAAKPA